MFYYIFCQFRHDCA